MALARRALPYGLFALAVVLVLMAASCADDSRPPGERKLALWSEFMTDDQVRASLPMLADKGADLYLAIPSERIGDPGLEQLVRDAAAADVGVRAWLLLPRELGYWPNEHNVDAMRTAAMALANWRDNAALPLDWIIFDMEMSLERTEAVAAIIEADGTLAGLDQLKAGRDPDAFVQSRAAYTDLVTDLQARGMRVMAVTYPTILDDAEDGDDDIQDQLDVPILGVPWDQASFMVYQSLIYDLSGEWHGPDVIKSYGDSARAQFGDRAALALGIVGSAGITPVNQSYPDAPTLLADHAAARASNVGTVSIYSLDGLMQQDDPEAWLDGDIAAMDPPEVTSEYVRKLIRSLLDD